jgi:acyl-coenzyme A thioesterase PaaI-like protein
MRGARPVRVDVIGPARCGDDLQAEIRPSRIEGRVIVGRIATTRHDDGGRVAVRPA